MKGGAQIMVVVNNTTPAQSESNGMGFLLGVLLLIVFVVLLLYYGLPLLRSSTSTPQLNVPNKVDINVHQTK